MVLIDRIASFNRTLFLFVFTCFSACAFAGMTVSGIYTGKNLRISNPVCTDGMGLTVTKVRVNGNIIPLIMNGDEVEVNFSMVGIAPGTPVTISIEYDYDTPPVVLNPHDLEAFVRNDATNTDRKHQQRQVEQQPLIIKENQEGSSKYH